MASNVGSFNGSIPTVRGPVVTSTNLSPGVRSTLYDPQGMSGELREPAKTLGDMVHESKTLEMVVDDRIAEAEKVVADWKGVKSKLMGPGVASLTVAEMRELLKTIHIYGG